MSVLCIGIPECLPVSVNTYWMNEWVNAEWMNSWPELSPTGPLSPICFPPLTLLAGPIPLQFLFSGFPWDAQILESHLQRFWLSMSEVECRFIDYTLGDAKAGGMELRRCIACDMKLFALSTGKLFAFKAWSVLPQLLKILTYSLFTHSLNVHRIGCHG